VAILKRKEFHYVWEWRLGATPDALWPFVSDTNRFNRDAGVPAVEQSAGATPGSRRLKLRRYGVLVEWDEEPFEWVRPRMFGVVRRYASGPVREMRVLTELRADGADATLLRYEVTATPRNLIGYAAIPFEIGLVSARRFEKVFRRYAEEARNPALPPYTQHRLEYLPRAAQLSPGGAARMARMRADLLLQFDDVLVDKLLDLIARGDDLTVARIRPYVLAQTWNSARRRAVDLCLYATRAGLLDLQWDVLCPMCRGAKQTNESLSGISQPVHCESCNIDFFANFEQSVELTFKPNHAVRAVEVFPFCVGGPQLTPHIVVQQVVHASDTRVLQPELEPGRYRLRAGDVAGAQLLRVEHGGLEQIDLTARSDGWSGSEVVLAPKVTCSFHNSTDQPRVMLLERVAWSDDALTAAEVIALQEFRDLFSAEALRPGEAINVGTLAILFTDLRDSTRMYRQIGDAPAFGRVMNHFDVLRKAMQEEEGAIVKTIGDAVMAVFRRPSGAIRAILRAQQLLAEQPDGVQAPHLKAGVHFGPCIAVTLNERLDYFGSTVNIAARLGSLSQGGEVVISETVAADPEVQSLLQESHVSVVKFQAQVKGYEETPLSLLRVTPNPAHPLTVSSIQNS
jgi:adenylate cyclase